MGSAAVVPPPEPRLVRAYHVTQAQYAINAMALRRLKVARFADLNDPFELLAANLNEKPARHVFGSLKNRYASKWGLLCFSSDWTNPVLWSHYGDRHKGVALGFDLVRTKAKPVVYDDNRLKAIIDEHVPTSIPKDLRQRLLLTKYKHWEYEQERRLLVRLKESIDEGRLQFWPFSPELRLAEVILGPQCPLSLDAVRRAAEISCPEAVVFGSRLAYKWFKVVPKERTVPRA